MADDLTVCTCSFCGGGVEFARKTFGLGPFWGLAATSEGAGSDYLATWCATCGPQHHKVTDQ